MNRALLTGCLVLCACPGASTPDAGGTGGGSDEVFFDVSGAATMWPEGVNLLADAGLPTTVAGLTARVEEPLKIALLDPLGQFSVATLDASGSFSASSISTELVNLGVAVGIVDDGGTPRVVRSATVIYDVAFEGKKPDKNLTDAKAWVLPRQLHDLLLSAVTPAKVQMLTGANNKSTLIEAGCILGRVVSATNAPVSSVTVVPTTPSLAGRFLYPKDDFSGTQASTSATGLFVYVHDGGDNVAQFNFDVMGASNYKRRSAGAVKDACLVVTVFPGATPP